MIKKIKAGGMTFSLNDKKDLVKVVVGKEVRYIKSIELWGIAYHITTDEIMKEQLMPVRKTEIMKFKKVHTVQLKNDMKAGETLQFTCLIDVPTRIIEGMRDIVEQEVVGSKEILDEVLSKPISTPLLTN